MKYWVYINGEVPGSYEPVELARIPGFSAAAMVCPAEGKDADRNWQRAGLFPDIAAALQDRPASGPPVPAPASPADYAQSSLAAQDVLDATSQRLFHHVTGLMKELENRREERALTQSLQRSLFDVKNELQAARERIRYLEDRASLIPGFEDREQKLRERLDKTRSDLKDRERRVDELSADLARITKALADASTEKENLAKIAEGLGRQLAEKELALAKSLGILRRLEEEMRQILPSYTGGIRPEVPKWSEEQRTAPPFAEPPPALPSAPSPETRSTEASPPAPEPRFSAPQPAPATPDAPPIPAPLADPRSARTPAEPLTPVDAASQDAPSPGAVPTPSAAPQETLAPPGKIFTQDEGKVEAPVPLPPEGVVAPVTPPWRVALSGLVKALKRYSPFAEPPPKSDPPNAPRS